MHSNLITTFLSNSLAFFSFSFFKLQTRVRSVPIISLHACDSPNLPFFSLEMKLYHVHPVRTRNSFLCCIKSTDVNRNNTWMTSRYNRVLQSSYDHLHKGSSLIVPDFPAISHNMKLKFKSLQGSTFTVDAESSDSVRISQWRVDCCHSYDDY
jgi:hypothetical protein